MRPQVNDEDKEINNLVVIGQIMVGGAELHLLRTLPLLKKHNIRSTVFSFNVDEKLSKEFEKNEIEIISTSKKPGVFADFFGFLKLVSIIRKRQPAIIHFYLPKAIVIGTIASFFTRKVKKCASRRSQNIYKNNHPLGYMIEIFFLRNYMDLVFCNSLAIKKELVLEKINPNIIKNIYNGVPDSYFIRQDKKESRIIIGIDEKSLVFVCVANLKPYKGHEDILRAFSKVNALLPSNWVLYCAGRDDGYGKYLFDLARELEIEKHIIWLGEYEDIHTLVCAADIGILASHQEGFPNSLLEKMALGLPVIAANVGGVTELLDDNNGILFSKGNVIELQNAILRLSDDHNERYMLGEVARKHVLNNYSMDKSIKEYAMAYSSIL
jgi:glycosyltransferase involved in cell wall biosynthesis